MGIWSRPDGSNISLSFTQWSGIKKRSPMGSVDDVKKQERDPQWEALKHKGITRTQSTELEVQNVVSRKYIDGQDSDNLKQQVW